MRGVVKRRSLKTSLIGIVAILTAVGGIAQSVLEGSAPDPEAVSALIAGAGLLFTRDNDVTSEDAGLK